MFIMAMIHASYDMEFEAVPVSTCTVRGECRLWERWGTQVRRFTREGAIAARTLKSGTYRY